jgi:hypothetical protein
MDGIRFVVDEKGNKTAVLIDLKEHGELWEDFYDSLIARARADEPRESLESVAPRLVTRRVRQAPAHRISRKWRYSSLVRWGFMLQFPRH